MAQTDRTLQETVTSLGPDDVIAAAKRFFARRNSVYTAFVDMDGPGWVTLRGAGGEETAIAARVQGNATTVTGSSYLFDQQIARFLSSLPVPDGSGALNLPEPLPESTDGAEVQS
jgi:hypothetical protein